jgi:hypothetical protein
VFKCKKQHLEVFCGVLVAIGVALELWALPNSLNSSHHEIARLNDRSTSNELARVQLEAKMLGVETNITQVTSDIAQIDPRKQPLTSITAFATILYKTNDATPILFPNARQFLAETENSFRTNPEISGQRLMAHIQVLLEERKNSPAALSLFGKSGSFELMADSPPVFTKVVGGNFFPLNTGPREAAVVGHDINSPDFLQCSISFTWEKQSREFFNSFSTNTNNIPGMRYSKLAGVIADSDPMIDLTPWFMLQNTEIIGGSVEVSFNSIERRFSIQPQRIQRIPHIEIEDQRWASFHSNMNLSR